MREWVVVFRLGMTLALAACSFEHGRLPGTAFPPPGDGGADSIDSVDASAMACGWSYQPTGADPCAGAQPVTEVSLCSTAELVYSTDSATLAGLAPVTTLDTSTTPSVRVIAVTRLELCAGTTLTIVGPYPLRVIVHGDAEIAGTIDVSAWYDGALWHSGPGGDACSAGNGAQGNASGDGASGGGGGGFGAAGGNSGDGDVVAAVAGGMVEGEPSLFPLRGGCPGGAGGAGDNTNVGRAGHGAGAIQIAARDMIHVSGSIEARGGPGGGGRGTDCGGGGGGTGGAILLEAASIAIDANAAVCANGGGGGGGGNDGGPFNAGGDGGPGTCALSAASGGPGGANNGQPGGNGGFGTTAAQDGRGADEGGGGGGGAVGRIRVRAVNTPTVSGLVTPPAS